MGEVHQRGALMKSPAVGNHSRFVLAEELKHRGNEWAKRVSVRRRFQGKKLLKCAECMLTRIFSVNLGTFFNFTGFGINY